MIQTLMSQKRPSLLLVKSEIYSSITLIHHELDSYLSRYYSITRMTTQVPDSEAPGCFSSQPSNGLFISVKTRLLAEKEVFYTNFLYILKVITPSFKQEYSANDRVLFPYFAFANLVNPAGKLERVKALALSLLQVTAIHTYPYIQVDIELSGPYCPKGNRVTHKKLQDRPDITYMEKEKCVLCVKELSLLPLIIY